MSPLLVKTISVGGLKVCAAGVGFVLTAFITRTLGAAESGLFLFGLSLISALSVFFRLGLEDVILRTMGAEGISPLSRRNLNMGLLWIVSIVVPFACASAVASDLIATLIFNKPEFSPVLFWMILALPAITIVGLLAMAFQGLHRSIIAIVFQGFGLSLLALVCFLVVWWLGIFNLSAESLAAIYAICAFLIFGLSVLIWCRQEGMPFYVGKVFDKSLWTASSNLWAASSMSLLVQWSGVIVAGAFITSEELAFFSAAQRTAMLISFVLVVVNMVVAPMYAKLWKENNINEMKRIARLSTRCMFACVLPAVIVIVIFPEWIMGLFGPGFEGGALLLIIMSLGQCVNVLTGSVGYLLTMSGHVRDFRKVMLFSGPVTVLLSYILTVEYGAVGAAVATAVGLSIQNIFALVMVRKRLGFWPLG
ncbi:MAG: oligosaccharide flippase family protein [Colwellia sp.]